MTGGWLGRRRAGAASAPKHATLRSLGATPIDHRAGPLDHLVRAGLMPADLGHTVFVQKPFLPNEILAALKSPSQSSAGPV